MGRLSGYQRSENEKLVEWVKKVKAENDQEAFEQIVKVLDTYLKHLALKKFRIAGNGSDDVYQEGLYALSTKAIPDYREEKGAFLSFAKLCIRRHIITVLKASNNGKNKALNGSVSLDSTACNDKDDGPVPISEFINNGKEDVTESITRMEVHSRLKNNLLDKLTDLEKQVLMFYLQNMSYLEIVRSMNKHRRSKNKVDCKTIDNALCRIKKKAAEIEKELRRKQRSSDEESEDAEDG